MRVIERFLGRKEIVPKVRGSSYPLTRILLQGHSPVQKHCIIGICGWDAALTCGFRGKEWESNDKQDDHRTGRWKACF